MNLKEAKEFLKLTPEETAVLEEYTGFSHTALNTLCNMEPDIYNRLSKGWKLLETKEDIENAINKFVNMYSAIYKNSYGNNGLSNLSRGTGNTQINAITNKTFSFLSTSRSEDIAKTFTSYGDDAIAKISLEAGVPYIDMTPYRHIEDRADEKEILIAPFCEVKRKNFLSNSDGYKYYSIGLSKPRLRERSDSELTELREAVVSGLEKNLADMKEYTSIIDDIELTDLRYKRYKEEGIIESQNDILKSRSKLIEKSHSIYSRVMTYRENVRNLLEGLCRQKEIEIEEAFKTIEEDEKLKQEERKKQIQFEVRQGQFEQLEGAIRRSSTKVKRTRRKPRWFLFWIIKK